MNASTTNSIPPEIIGLTRLAFADIDAAHKAAMAAVFALPRKLVEDLAYGFTRKRDAARQQLLRLMPIPPHVVVPRTLVFRSVRICRQPLSDDLTHHGAEVCWLACGLIRGRAGIADKPASFFLNFHGAGRLLQRSWPRADIRTAILAAHDALCAAPEDALPVLEQNGHWMVPTIGGAFGCDVHVIRDLQDDTHLYLRGATYLANDQLAASQRAQVAAMRFQDGRTLGDGLCMPPQLRAKIDRATAR